MIKKTKNLSLDQVEDWLSSIILEFMMLNFFFLSKPVFFILWVFFLKAKIHDHLRWFIY